MAERVTLDAWRLAVGTLTALPTAPPGRVDAAVAGRAMVLAPLAVVSLGLGVGLVCWLGSPLGLPPLVVGLLAVAVLVLGTRALHVDGLSDVADGLTASYDAERSLAVMKSGTSGPAGGAAVLLVLGLQAAGFAALTGGGSGLAVTAGLAVCGSRCALTLTCVRGVPGARADGLGSTYIGSVARRAAALWWLAVATLLALSLDLAGRSWWLGPIAALAAVLTVAALIRRTVARFGGVTGDVFGAGVELGLAALLVVLAAGA